MFREGMAAAGYWAGTSYVDLGPLWLKLNSKICHLPGSSLGHLPSLSVLLTSGEPSSPGKVSGELAARCQGCR